MFSRRAELLEKNPPREGERVISTLKPYPAHKDSGVEWLGQVPEHWEVLPGRTVFREINDRGHPDEQMLSVTITRGVLRQADLLADSSKKDSSNEDKSNYKLVQPGDLVYNKMRAWQGAVGVSAYRGIVSPAYIVQRLRSAENLARYMHFLLRTPLFASEAERWSYGITSDQWSLRAEEFKCIYFSLPPLLEQTAIVRFLDWAGRRIRRVIRARQRRIKLLEEYKQALIHRAVTGKIDVRTCQPYPAYKPSGVEWLGDVPVHWDIVPNRAVLRLKKHLVGKASTDYTLLSLTKGGIVVRDLENPEGKFPTSFDTYQVVEPGDIIFCLFDIDETPRAIGLSSLHGMITGAYTVFECTDPVVRAYVYLFYLAMDNGKFLKPLYTGLRKVITKSAFLTAKMPLPTKEEQTAIVEYLDAQTAKIDTAIAAARREIDLLREYRTRLISDVVTGKVDVREVAARLPEEPSEEDAPWTDEEESAQDEALNGEGDHAAISEEDG
ncbi:restriction endonuclease subunit S [Neomoorella mulderi]|uniref:Type I restriction modification DNA specificity domain protein n=1 Tax=Moorella mulderi DSM 14980 TaxID=1122241 RepID=A0A151AZU4_9FIRM|nr:restriction endonuclease subunit S [Moorella mulderi]KYH33080.1 type I restriction modification DNA specificity domain protein [Moorella mulderi DSM 14980]